MTGSLTKSFRFSSLRKCVLLKVDWESFCSVLCSSGVDNLNSLDLSTLGQFEGLWVKHQKDAKDKAISKLGLTPWLTLRFDSNTQHVGTRTQTDSEALLLETGKENSLNWRDTLDLWPFPDSSLVSYPLCDSPFPRSLSQNKPVSLTQSPTTRNQNHVLGRNQQQPADENGESFQGYWVKECWEGQTKQVRSKGFGGTGHQKETQTRS